MRETVAAPCGDSGGAATRSGGLMIIPEGDPQLHDATLHLLHTAATQFARVAAAVATGDATPELLEARQQELQVAACAFAEVLQGGVLDDPAAAVPAELLPPELSPALRGRVLPSCAACRGWTRRKCSPSWGPSRTRRRRPRSRKKRAFGERWLATCPATRAFWRASARTWTASTSRITARGASRRGRGRAGRLTHSRARRRWVARASRRGAAPAARAGSARPAGAARRRPPAPAPRR